MSAFNTKELFLILNDLFRQTDERLRAAPQGIEECRAQLSLEIDQEYVRGSFDGARPFAFSLSFAGFRGPGSLTMAIDATRRQRTLAYLALMDFLTSNEYVAASFGQSMASAIAYAERDFVVVDGGVNTHYAALRRNAATAIARAEYGHRFLPPVPEVRVAASQPVA